MGFEQSGRRSFLFRPEDVTSGRGVVGEAGTHAHPSVVAGHLTVAGGGNNGGCLCASRIGLELRPHSKDYETLWLRYVMKSECYMLFVLSCRITTCNSTGANLDDR